MTESTEKSNLEKISKFLSYVLRHKPEKIDLKLDKNGWAMVSELIGKAKIKGTILDKATLDQVVEQDGKGRYSYSPDGLKIRANQGHSVAVDLKLQAIRPPAILYHGTSTKALDSILASGLNKGRRHHVHLTENKLMACAVGSRYGEPVLVEINSHAMNADGFKFFRSENDVWLTDFVPAKYLRVIEVTIAEG